MKNKIVVFSLLGLFLSISSLNATEGKILKRAPEVEWADTKISESLVSDFDTMKKKHFDNKNIEELTSNLKKLSNNTKFNTIVDKFINKIKENKEKNDEIQALRNCLVNKDEKNATLGYFVYKLYKFYEDYKQDLSELPVKKRVALRDEGYYNEYFLDDTVDKEKTTSMIYYLYSETTMRLKGLLSMLGFGYTDKRSWGRYLRNRGIGAAVIGGAAAAAYYGGKSAVKNNRDDAIRKMAMSLGEIPGDTGMEDFLELQNQIKPDQTFFAKGVRKLTNTLEKWNNNGVDHTKKMAMNLGENPSDHDTQDFLRLQQEEGFSNPSLYDKAKQGLINFFSSEKYKNTIDSQHEPVEKDYLISQEKRGNLERSWFDRAIVNATAALRGLNKRDKKPAAMGLGKNPGDTGMEDHINSQHEPVKQPMNKDDYLRLQKERGNLERSWFDRAIVNATGALRGLFRWNNNAQKGQVKNTKNYEEGDYLRYRDENPHSDGSWL